MPTRPCQAPVPKKLLGGMRAVVPSKPELNNRFADEEIFENYLANDDQRSHRTISGRRPKPRCAVGYRLLETRSKHSELAATIETANGEAAESGGLDRFGPECPRTSEGRRQAGSCSKSANHRSTGK